ncbi:hypothetical protein K5E_11270 [Enterococcus thailandicus]|uniref:hypothetical protein n=1 Tax=Enterococcus thailandicus TaxID=417368 RepID=UPI00244D86D2|nr:hypothetical protein [Enterococcus thailandicus]GMC02575.1 hypothetical protein K4E_00850 [Enterococcus thailandicus]GMC08988.1 hypothetical protein K5E_11270 [Enterococcus thailandicus]
MNKFEEMTEIEAKQRIEYLENYIEILSRSILEAEKELEYLKLNYDIPPFLQDLIDKEQAMMAQYA